MKIYFNNWFSSIAPIIADIKKRHGKFVEIYGSSHNPNHVMVDVVDHFAVEKWNFEKGGEGYVEWVKDFIKSRNIDVFFVKKWTEEVLKHRKEIEQYGTVIVSDDLEKYLLTDNKAKTYKILEPVAKIPRYILSNNAKAIINFMQGYPQSYCFKLNNGEGGESFKKITADKLTMNDFENGIHNRIDWEELKQVLTCANPEDLEKFIFMEYLPSPEISADCYNSKQGFICICRSKLGSTRVERIYYSKKCSETCEKIGQTIGFKYPFNVQFRLQKGGNEEDFNDYRLLEVNPRISGGSYYQQTIGLNICDVCLCDIAKADGYDIADYIGFKDRLISHVETPVLIDKTLAGVMPKEFR